MCTSQASDEIVVYDVALADIRRLVGTLPGVELTHLPYEGTRVRSTGSLPVAVFREALADASAPPGGSLPG
jgi:hypothetical protein